MQEIRSDKGSVFLLCRWHFEDPSYPKYPRLPVLSCRAFIPVLTQPGSQRQP